jgi:DNA-directed RNA polymerase specialized sigma24 family protein
MGVLDETATPGPPRGQWFATTHWSVVLAAADVASDDAKAALEKLCRTYWFPLYAYVRHQGHGSEEAKDLTQGFFARLLEKNYLGQVDRRKGKFRSFLLASLRHFLSDERDRANAAKRGGGQSLVSFDAQGAEQRYRLEPVDEVSPDKVFDRRWAVALLEEAQWRLREEYATAGKGELFDALAGGGVATAAEATYAELAARWAMSESAVKSAAHRLRQRYHELVRNEVAHTVANPAELDEEIRYLVSVIGS